MTKKIDLLRNLTDEDLVDICDNYTSASKYLETLNISLNGRHITYINNRRKDLNLEWLKKPIRVQVCPVCDKNFKPTASPSRGQTTCSKSCANTYFRSGIDNPNYNPSTIEYRILCFRHRKKECIICGEDKVVDVHHFDENRDNNEINNLIPLCPTHHRYFHSQNRYLVESQIIQWRLNNMIV